MWCLINPVNNLSIAIWCQKWLLYWYFGPPVGATESDMPWEVGLIKPPGNSLKLLETTLKTRIKQLIRMMLFYVLLVYGWGHFDFLLWLWYMSILIYLSMIFHRYAIHAALHTSCYIFQRNRISLDPRIFENTQIYSRFDLALWPTSLFLLHYWNNSMHEAWEGMDRDILQCRTMRQWGVVVDDWEDQKNTLIINQTSVFKITRYVWHVNKIG